MQIYHYHPTTGIFLQEGIADPSPLEPDVFLIPAYSTELEPPASIEGAEIVFNGATWESRLIEIPMSPVKNVAEIAIEKTAAVQEEKCRIRDSGVLVGGILFDTDLAARIAYMELFMQFSTDPTFAVDWKASDGNWVVMTAELYQSVIEAGKAHIQAAFEWQAQKDIEIAAALLAGDREGLEAIETTYE